MKNSQTIIYDDTCPMCTWYTGRFIKAGVLDSRLPFSKLNSEYKNKLDLNRSRHEIPLIDTQTGKVRYGLDTLTYLLSNLMPWANGLLNNPFFKRLLRPLYQFISYNRRIIVPSVSPKGSFDAAPDFHAGWRIALISFILLLNMGLHHFFAQWVTHYLHYAGYVSTFELFFWVNIAFLCSLCSSIHLESILNHIAQVLISMLITTIFTMPVWIFSTLIIRHLPSLYFAVLFSLFESFFIFILFRRNQK